MLIDEQHDSIDEDPGELCQPPVALRGTEVRRNRSSGEGLETQEQPRGIVRDLHDVGTVAPELNGYACPFEIVGGQGGTDQDNRSRERKETQR